MTVSGRPHVVAGPVAGTAQYRVDGEACTQLLLRVLGLIAQHCDMFERLSAGRRGDRLWIKLTAPGLSEHRARIVAAKIEAVVGVSKAELRWSA